LEVIKTPSGYVQLAAQTMYLIDIETYGAGLEKFKEMLFQLCSPFRAVPAGSIFTNTIILTYIPPAGLS
jgi:hypothetical protein